MTRIKYNYDKSSMIDMCFKGRISVSQINEQL